MLCLDHPTSDRYEDSVVDACANVLERARKAIVGLFTMAERYGARKSQREWESELPAQSALVLCWWSGSSRVSGGGRDTRVPFFWLPQIFCYSNEDVLLATRQDQLSVVLQ